MNEEKHFFDTYVADEADTSVVNLPDGTHAVRIHSVKKVTDMNASLTTNKRKDPREWKDELDQLAIVLVGYGPSAGKGVAVLRLNAWGFKRHTEIPEDKRKEYFPAGPREYAVHKKDKVRVVDPARTEQCKMFIDQFFTAAGCAGKHYDDLVGQKLLVNIAREIYNDVEQIRVTNPKPYNEDELVDAPEEKEAY